MALDRRKFLTTSLGAAAIAGFAACSASPGAPGSVAASPSSSALSEDERQKAMNTPTDLTFWTWVPDIQNEVDLFEAKYPRSR